MWTKAMKTAISSKRSIIVVNSIRKTSLKDEFRSKNENFAVLILKIMCCDYTIFVTFQTFLINF
ncbi:hypothetical protein B9T30_09220 [Acinetobacter sp. ANC 4973]|nr:hypothetical protein B9T30_09220 [Acinetobacter sp. ANC 4973]